MAEYGDPDDPADRESSPNTRHTRTFGRRRYPPMLITTSTHDDRVHPGHARKMTRR